MLEVATYIRSLVVIAVRGIGMDVGDGDGLEDRNDGLHVVQLGVRKGSDNGSNRKQNNMTYQKLRNGIVDTDLFNIF